MFDYLNNLNNPQINFDTLLSIGTTVYKNERN